jgi:hypothetical protein
MSRVGKRAFSNIEDSCAGNVGRGHLNGICTPRQRSIARVVITTIMPMTRRRALAGALAGSSLVLRQPGAGER